MLNRGLCSEGMGKSAKTFTIDIKILAWLEKYAKKENEKESHIVNDVLHSLMRHASTWTCSKCNGTNVNASAVCYANASCDGVKA